MYDYAFVLTAFTGVPRFMHCRFSVTARVRLCTWLKSERVENARVQTSTSTSVTGASVLIVTGCYQPWLNRALLAQLKLETDRRGPFIRQS